MTTIEERKKLSENPKYQIGDVIQVTTSYNAGPGVKDLKTGKYIITGFRDSHFVSVEYYKIYEFKSTRKNSTYVYTFEQKWLEVNSHMSA